MSKIERLAEKDFDELWNEVPLINKIGLFKSTIFTFYLAGYSKGALRGIELVEKIK